MVKSSLWYIFFSDTCILNCTFDRTVGSINLKRCLCLAIRNQVFGEYNFNPEGFCNSTSGTCATVNAKMTPFSPHKFSHFFRFFRKAARKRGSIPARYPNFWYSKTNMTYLDGAGQFLGLAISRPRNSLANNPISTIFAYQVTESRALRAPHDTYTTFGVLKRTDFSSLSRWCL